MRIVLCEAKSRPIHSLSDLVKWLTAHLLRYLAIVLPLAIYLLVYQPARARNLQQSDELLQARSRVQQLQLRCKHLREHINALQNNEPAVIEEAVRQSLRQGSFGETVTQPLYMNLE